MERSKVLYRPKSITAAFAFQKWPTTTKVITQVFGANPDKYKPYGLPGHEGIDIAAPFGTPYFAVAPGVVIWSSDQRRSGGASAYGYHVILDHGRGFTTLYAHAKREGRAAVGQALQAGDIVAVSGDTGNSYGPHLHLTLKEKGYKLTNWPPGYRDPWPYLKPLMG